MPSMKDHPAILILTLLAQASGLDHSGQGQSGALRSQIFVGWFKNTPTTGTLQAASVHFLTQC